MSIQIDVGTNAVEELYGPGAITGNLDDIEVQISAGGNHVLVKPEGDGEAPGGQTDKVVEPATPNPDGDTNDATPKDGQEAPDGNGEDPAVERAELKDAINNLGEDLKGKGFDLDSALQELEDKGELSAETYAKLEAVGYKKAVIDGYIKAAEIVERNFANAVFGLVGTEAEYKQVLAWANANASKADQKAYDAALDRGDLNTAKLYIDNFKAKMGVTFGSGNPRVPGAPAGVVTVDGFNTKAELTKATSDSRYGRDRAYTEEIQKRIIKTTWL